MEDSNLEREILAEIKRNGIITSTVTNLINNNIGILSPSFLTDILVENISIRSEGLLLIEYLPYIFNKINNSENIIEYLVGVTHYILYLAREPYPGKDINDGNIQKVYEVVSTHQYFTLVGKIKCKEINEEEINDFYTFIDKLQNAPTYKCKLEQILRFNATLWLKLFDIYDQEFYNVDELALFLSRCLILWKMGSMNNEELLQCLERVVNHINMKLNEELFENTLFLELHNYQFLNLRFPKWIGRTLARIIKKSI